MALGQIGIYSYLPTEFFFERPPLSASKECRCDCGSEITVGLDHSQVVWSNKLKTGVAGAGEDCDDSNHHHFKIERKTKENGMFKLLSIQFEPGNRQVSLIANALDREVLYPVLLVQPIEAVPGIRRRLGVPEEVAMEAAYATSIAATVPEPNLLHLLHEFSLTVLKSSSQPIIDDSLTQQQDALHDVHGVVFTNIPGVQDLEELFVLFCSEFDAFPEELLRALLHGKTLPKVDQCILLHKPFGIKFFDNLPGFVKLRVTTKACSWARAVVVSRGILTKR